MDGGPRMTTRLTCVFPRLERNTAYRVLVNSALPYGYPHPLSRSKCRKFAPPLGHQRFRRIVTRQDDASLSHQMGHAWARRTGTARPWMTQGNGKRLHNTLYVYPQSCECRNALHMIGPTSCSTFNSSYYAEFGTRLLRTYIRQNAGAPEASGHRVFSSSYLVYLLLHRTAMAFASLFALVALAAVSRAAPATEAALCPDGTRVSNAACCAFIPVSTALSNGLWSFFLNNMVVF